MDKKKNTAKLNLVFEREEKLKRAEELIVTNTELTFQIAEKQKRVEELLIVNKELTFFSRFGDLISYTSVIISILIILFSIFLRFRK